VIVLIVVSTQPRGSAEVKMGMSLYESSKVARLIWDSADRYFMNTYGFSILHIVNANPKSITIFFGGEKGKKIRQNFMNLTQSTQVLSPS
jgi:fatty acid synthase subunit beta